jgi:hypothetical protein
MKHVGKMKNNNAKVVVVYRTLPGDPYSALVVGSASLGASYHDALMNLVQDPSGQSANEFADILAVRKFPDGNNMLSWLHTYGHLKKVPTNLVIMTPTPQASVALDELNSIIAEQKGVSLEDLAVKSNKDDISIKPTKEETTMSTPLTAPELRSKADALFKEAQQLRKQADELDPPKRRPKKVEVEAE